MKIADRARIFQRGSAAQPGIGPKGETCKTCQHYARIRHTNTCRKCRLVEAHWTCGPGTDILARSPACHKWQFRQLTRKQSP
ncbi:MAG: hypothetical protein HY736_09370 [Verrucomicrobia bacterium]|nr:hypothetical protein [Verrucomicrobiota bacterium]